jgi:hypothetical protein
MCAAGSVVLSSTSWPRAASSIATAAAAGRLPHAALPHRQDHAAPVALDGVDERGDRPGPAAKALGRCRGCGRPRRPRREREHTAQSVDAHRRPRQQRHVGARQVPQSAEGSVASASRPRASSASATGSSRSVAVKTPFTISR